MTNFKMFYLVTYPTIVKDFRWDIVYTLRAHSELFST